MANKTLGSVPTATSASSGNSDGSAGSGDPGQEPGTSPQGRGGRNPSQNRKEADQDILEADAKQPRKTSAAKVLGTVSGAGKNFLQEAPQGIGADHDFDLLAGDATTGDAEA